MPCAVAMPMSATPTVPAVVHELPVASETKPQMMQALGRNTAGDSSCRP
jgi:hypothetical protein